MIEKMKTEKGTSLNGIRINTIAAHHKIVKINTCSASNDLLNTLKVSVKKSLCKKTAVTIAAKGNTTKI